MFAFILRRLLQAVAVMLTVALLAFVLFQYVGDPVTIMLGQDATDAERVELRERLGLNEPAVVQFGHFVANAAQGNFGISLRQSEPVSLLKSRLPATLELSLVAAVLALVVGVPLGVYTALKRNSMLSQLLLAGSLLGVSLPTFLIGILLILVFSVQLGWLPSYGRGETVSLGWWSSGLFTADGWKHLILPSITLSLFQMTLVLRLVRSEMLEVLRSDYIKFARARGLKRRAIHFGHALKNTMVPVITITGLQLGGIIAFAIVTETVFQWPGMGLLFIQAVQFADVPVMAAYLCLIALVFVVINLIVDLLYFVVDPRLRAGMTRAGGSLMRAVLKRWWDSDLAWTWRRAPVAIAATILLALLLIGSFGAGWVAPHNPFDLTKVELLDALLPPAWQANGQPTYLLGTDSQGRDLYSAILYGTRVSLLIGLAAVALSMVIGIVLGLVSGYAGGRIDAFIMRVADVQLSFPAILIALLIDGVARRGAARAARGDRLPGAGRRDRACRLAAVRPHGARLHPGGEEPRIRAGRARDRRGLARHHVPPRAAQCAGTGAGAGHGAPGHRHHHRGDAVVPGRGRAADVAVAGHVDPHRQRFPVLRRMVDRHLPRTGAGAVGAVGQPAR